MSVEPSRRLRVLVARPRRVAGELVELLTAAGFEPVIVPLVDTTPTASGAAALAAALGDPAGYAYVAFTSAAAVEATRTVAAALPAPAVVVGPATGRAVLAHGWHVAVEAPDGTGASLASALPDPRPGADRVLFPAGAIAGDEFPAGAAARGWTVVGIEVYRTDAVPLDTSDLDRLATVDAAVMTSPSVVRAYRAAARRGFPPFVVAIGPTTAAAVEAAGGTCAVARERSAAGLVAALVGAVGDTATGP